MTQSIVDACSSRLIPRAVRQDERGATLIEATYVIPFLLLFLLMTSQVVLLLYDAVSIEYVLERSARDIASIGVGQASNTRVQAIKTSIRGRAAELGVSLADNDIWVCPAVMGMDENVPCATQSAGLPNQSVLIAVRKNKPLMFLSRVTFPISTQVMVRNEPFLGSVS